MEGNIPEWISALAALAALAAATWAAVTSRKLFEIETQRDATARQRREMEQASAVAAWCVTYTPPGEGSSPKGLLLHNSSDAPVFDLVINSIYTKKKNDPPEAQPPLKLPVLTPGDHVSVENNIYPWAFPQSAESFEQRTGMKLRPVTNNKGWMVTGVSFVDSYGIHWVRDGRGQLKRQSEHKVS